MSMQEAGELDDGEVRLLRPRAVEEECIRVNLQRQRPAIGQPRRRVGEPRQALCNRRMPVRVQGNRAGCRLARTRELRESGRDVCR